MKDKSAVIFGNEIDAKSQAKARKTKKGYLKKFGDDSKTTYKLTTVNNETLNGFLGVQNIAVNKEGGKIDTQKGVIVGNIRMGFGHYRISMAIASAAHSMGYIPYWLDLRSYKETTGGKVVGKLDELYSMGSRWSQKYPLFNKLYWEPLNYEGFRKLSYNALDQKVTEIMAQVCKELPKDIPFLATHVWPAQAAIHAGVKNVVNVIPDNWPMALHLAEGSVHTVQSPSAYFGYRTLRGMNGDAILKPMPDADLVYTGHYIDHELVVNLEADCAKRSKRVKEGKRRLLLTVGGAGAQKEIFASIIKQNLADVKAGKVTLFINVGDHKNVWDGLVGEVPELDKLATKYFDKWNEATKFASDAVEGETKGIYAFYNKDIFAAVYMSNLLMRVSDILITKPSELAYYPIPKLMIKRVGGHEMWGAIRAAEIGDGTIECDTTGNALQMLGLMTKETTIMNIMIDSIVKQHSIGIYNGAYKAVELAVKGRK